MLRRVLLWIGGLLVVLGVLLLVVARAPGGFAPAVFGAILLLALAFERYRYKRVLDTPPGPDWQATGERFRDPGGGSQIAVYYQPSTGRRAYVRQQGD